MNPCLVAVLLIFTWKRWFQSVADTRAWRLRVALIGWRSIYLNKRSANQRAAPGVVTSRRTAAINGFVSFWSRELPSSLSARGTSDWRNQSVVVSDRLWLLPLPSVGADGGGRGHPLRLRLQRLLRLSAAAGGQHEVIPGTPGRAREPAAHLQVATPPHLQSRDTKQFRYILIYLDIKMSISLISWI